MSAIQWKPIQNQATDNYSSLNQYYASNLLTPSQAMELFSFGSPSIEPEDYYKDKEKKEVLALDFNNALQESARN